MEAPLLKVQADAGSGHEADRAHQDEADLRHLGYAQELFRSMGGFSNFALSFSIISILTGAVTLFDYGLQMGGPAEMAFGWPLVALFTLAVAASMAELASAYPASGGMYDWATRLGGPGWGWFTAWFSIVGLIATLAGVDYGCAQFVTPLLGLNATSRTLLVVYAVILASHGLINHFGIRLVAWLNDFSVTVHILGVLVIAGALLIFAPKHPVAFFFQAETTTSFPYGLAFLVGLLQAQWTFTGYDASAHLAEETVDPRRRAPWGIVNSVVISAVAGYLLLLALTLSMRSIGSVLGAHDASGHPIPAVIAILEQGLGARAGAAASLLAAMAMWFCGLSTVASTSRTIFAFARDRGMPLSSFWSTVSAKHRTPSPAIWLSAGAALTISIYSGAYPVVTSISTVGLYVAYVIPIILGYRARRRGLWTEYGPWRLGRFSSTVNLLAILWTIFICVILMMPPNQLAGKTMASFLAILLVWYGLTERRKLAQRAAVKPSIEG
ncbi:MAG TPA: amino acid permease [Terriglobia bacterium]|nr:amino acid permease [Terriglobia bacterium]